MQTKKLFAGNLIRRRRDELRLTQAALAKQLRISPSYLNQIEANLRPLTATLLLGVSRTLRLGLAELSDDGPARLTSDLHEMLTDPLFQGAAVGAREVRSLALSAPELARAVLELHAGYRRLDEKVRSLSDALQTGEADAQPGHHLSAPPLSAYDEVRDFFHFIGNYVDPLDRSAENVADRLGGGGPVSFEALAAHVAERVGTRVVVAAEPDPTGVLSRYDPASKTLTLDIGQDAATRTFLLACHLAVRTEAETIDRLLVDARFRNAASADIARLALANYFAGALLLPYGAFHMAAQRTRHDVERLTRLFGASVEQVCHRLSTMQRPGAAGLPFYFLRVDRAGNITKRHSATRLRFARYGGACPLWNIHEAFETPDRLLVQVAEMPDGVRYLSIARTITKTGGHFGSARRHYAIGFGCELSHAADLVYSDGLDLRDPSNVARIGVSCRICERADCHQRAFPPYDAVITVDPLRRGVLPYRLDAPSRRDT